MIVTGCTSCHGCGIDGWGMACSICGCGFWVDPTIPDEQFYSKTDPEDSPTSETADQYPEGGPPSSLGSPPGAEE